MTPEELVVESHRTTVPELELVSGKVRESRWRYVLAAELAVIQVQRETSHLPRAIEERTSAH